MAPVNKITIYCELLRVRIARSAFAALALREVVIVVFVVLGGQFVLEVVNGAAGLVDEAAHVAGHLRQPAGAEDQEEQQADDDHLLRTNSEHTVNITFRPHAYNEFAARAYILEDMKYPARSV